MAQDKKFRRCVRYWKRVGTVAVFRTKSWSRDCGKMLHYPQVDLETGDCRCTCEHFRFRLARKFPHRSSPETLCFHLKLAVSTIERRDRIERLRITPKAYVA